MKVYADILSGIHTVELCGWNVRSALLYLKCSQCIQIDVLWAYQFYLNIIFQNLRIHSSPEGTCSNKGVKVLVVDDKSLPTEGLVAISNVK